MLCGDLFNEIKENMNVAQDELDTISDPLYAFLKDFKGNSDFDL